MNVGGLTELGKLGRGLTDIFSLTEEFKIESILNRETQS